MSQTTRRRERLSRVSEAFGEMLQEKFWCSFRFVWICAGSSANQGVRAMQQEEFRSWLSCVDELTEAQRNEMLTVLSGRTTESASAATELGVGEDRRCLRCNSPGAVSMGRSRGLRCCKCKSCGRTLSSLLPTPARPGSEAAHG